MKSKFFRGLRLLLGGRPPRIPSEELDLLIGNCSKKRQYRQDNKASCDLYQLYPSVIRKQGEIDTFQYLNRRDTDQLLKHCAKIYYLKVSSTLPLTTDHVGDTRTCDTLIMTLVRHSSVFWTLFGPLLSRAPIACSLLHYTPEPFVMLITTPVNSLICK